MSVKHIDEQLSASYRNWKTSLNLSQDEMKLLSPPFLLQANDDYVSSPQKVIIFGKETKGWQWNSQLRKNWPKYPKDWEYTNIDKLGYFANNEDSVEALMSAYGQFENSKYQLRNLNGPFFRAFRRISDDSRNRCLA